MNKVVLDASAILTIIHQKPGVEKLNPELLARAVASAVNMAEVQSKLVSHGWPAGEAWEDGTSPVAEIVPFDAEQARIAGDLTAQTRPYGLSLGDRACLALGLALRAPVYTSERIWESLHVGIPIHVLR